MEEDEFRSTYHAVNRQRCVFEKTILTRKADCEFAGRFCIAEREGVACRHDEAHQRCSQTLEGMREKALFALRLTHLADQLPHGKEIKVQSGGLIGLHHLLEADATPDTIPNINALLEQAAQKYGGLDSLPYDEIVRWIVSFKPRRQGVGAKS
jgi:hypothetical protein